MQWRDLLVFFHWFDYHLYQIDIKEKALGKATVLLFRYNCEILLWSSSASIFCCIFTIFNSFSTFFIYEISGKPLDSSDVGICALPPFAFIRRRRGLRRGEGGFLLRLSHSNNKKHWENTITYLLNFTYKTKRNIIILFKLFLP